MRCKISGIVAFVPPGQWHAKDLAPVVNHCLDTFGPDRVFFGGDWPVCLLGSPVRGWEDALKQIIYLTPHQRAAQALERECDAVLWAEGLKASRREERN